jgi:hypothetical protein
MAIYRYTIDINAPAEKVWKILWDDTTYRIWAAAFHEGTRAVSDWKAGSRILFVEENGNGAFADILANEPFRLMSFRHLGWTGNFQELPPDMEFIIDGKAVKWSGGDENYILSENEGHTVLTVEMTGDFGQWEDHLNRTYPRALIKVKELSELAD